MPGSTRSMQLEHVLRNVQTDRGSLLHGRLLRWQFDTVTLAHRMPSGGVHPITPMEPIPGGIANGGWGHEDAFPRPKLSSRCWSVEPSDRISEGPLPFPRCCFRFVE